MYIKDNICFYKLNSRKIEYIKYLLNSKYYNFFDINNFDSLSTIRENISVIITESLDGSEESLLNEYSLRRDTPILFLDDERENRFTASLSNENFLYYFIKTLCRISWISRLSKEKTDGEYISSYKDHYSRTIEMLGEFDSHSKDHSYKVLEYTNLIANEFNLDDNDKRKLNIAAFLHDIGKTIIPKEILLSPKKLSKEEFDIIKLHTTLFDSVVFDEINEIKDIIRHHHEKYDGSGYPDNLKGEDIPFLSRIITVVDSYDAMTSKRIYNNPVSKEEAIKRLSKDSNTHFDPVIAERFISILKENN